MKLPVPEEFQTMDAYSELLTEMARSLEGPSS